MSQWCVWAQAASNCLVILVLAHSHNRYGIFRVRLASFSLSIEFQCFSVNNSTTVSEMLSTRARFGSPKGPLPHCQQKRNFDNIYPTNIQTIHKLLGRIEIARFACLLFGFGTSHISTAREIILICDIDLILFSGLFSSWEIFVPSMCMFCNVLTTMWCIQPFLPNAFHQRALWNSSVPFRCGIFTWNFSSTVRRMNNMTHRVRVNLSDSYSRTIE